MSVYKRPWTPEEDEMLRKATEDGVSLQRLSARFHRPVRVIEKRAKVLGLVAKPVQRLAYSERVFDSRTRVPNRKREYGSPER